MVLLNMHILPGNKALFVLFVYYVYFVMCVFVLIFNNKDNIMTQIFIFPHFGLNIHHHFLYFVTLKRFIFVIGTLFWLHCSDTIVKST